MARLDGRVAIVTGAARGIGERIAARFAAEGASVLLADRRDELGEGAAAAIRQAGGRAVYAHLDVTSQDDWRTAVARAEAELGGVDVLVNDAGVIRVKPFVDTTLDELQKVLGVNVVGAFLGMQAVVEPMRRRGGGSIVNFSSVQGMEGREGMSAYSASKFGVRGLSKSVAIELGPLGIRVNVIVPGPTRTRMTEREGWTDEQYDAVYGGYPLGRMASADEIAGMAIFLASDESSFCTGADFVVDGGVLAGKPRS
jgi:3alpha(or 20beta)-hydroxysteroid dehydrogenase